MLLCEPTAVLPDAPKPADALARASLDRVESLPGAGSLDLEPADPDDVVEIVFTSGTTGDPKGVVHRHRNICANLQPVEREIHRLQIALHLVGSLRLLDMLPLSHMFGQSLGLYVPVLLQGTSVFTDEFTPGAVLDAIRRESVTAVAVVPRMLESLQHEVERRFDSPTSVLEDGRRGLSPLAHIWKHRSLHAALGWRFWFLVVGGSTVRTTLERFWGRRGFVVVQGYGLTETSPVVAVNHPLRARRGSIGRALPGLEVRIADDGEILVRGDSVVSEYWTKRGSEPVCAQDGWLHTGDLGDIDADGQLYYRGRKKDVIVLADGTNVHPQDVEALLNASTAVRESTVVGVETPGGWRVHAVLILTDDGADLEALIGVVNAKLESHQRIQSWSVWPEADFPRTLSTAKIKRVEVARVVNEALPHGSGSSASPLVSATAPDQSDLARTNVAIASVAQRDLSHVRSDMHLENDLGLSSLERVELLSILEHEFEMDLDETQFARLETVAELGAWVEAQRRAVADSNRATAAFQPGSGPGIGPVSSRGRAGAPPPVRVGPDARLPGVASGATGGSTAATPRASGEHVGVGSMAALQPDAGVAVQRADREIPLPRWRSHWFVRLKRRLFQDAILVPLFRSYFDFRVHGLENLDGLQPPVLFAANHTSHFDTPAVLAALPPAWRRHMAPAMMPEYFRTYFQAPRAHGSGRWLRGVQFHLACGLLNAFPLPQTMGGTRRALRYMGEQVDWSACPLVFPEGGRSRDGSLQAFKPGIGLMAVHMRVPVVPIHLAGVFEALPPGARKPRHGRIDVRVGAALHFAAGEDQQVAASRVEQAIRTLAQS